jgi:hypothetical protein
MDELVESSKQKVFTLRSCILQKIRKAKKNYKNPWFLGREGDVTVQALTHEV